MYGVAYPFFVHLQQSYGNMFLGLTVGALHFLRVPQISHHESKVFEILTGCGEANSEIRFHIRTPESDVLTRKFSSFTMERSVAWRGSHTRTRFCDASRL